MDAHPDRSPRRLLIFSASLELEDATLRALDLARHLQSAGICTVTVISPHEGLLGSAFRAAGADAVVVDPAQRDHTTGRLAQADAAIIFGPAEPWMNTFVHQQGTTPVLETDLLDRGLIAPWFDPTVDIRTRQPLRDSLALKENEHLALTFASRSSLAEVSATLGEAHAWLDRPGLPRWRFIVIGPDGQLHAVNGSLRESAGNSAALQSRAGWVSAADAVIRLENGDGCVRPLLNGAALAVPVITSRTVCFDGILPESLMIVLSRNKPRELAHCLIDLVANPTASARRVAAAHWHAINNHQPTMQLARLEALLESTAAMEAKLSGFSLSG